MTSSSVHEVRDAVSAPPEVAVALRVPTVLVRRVLLGLVLLMTLGHLVFVVPELGGGHLFDLDRESGPGTWVSTTLFTITALVAVWLTARVHPDRRSLGFVLLALLLLALGAEEVMAFHETASVELAGAADLAGADSGGTPLMGLVLLPWLGVGAWLLARRCAPKARLLLLLGTGLWFVATFVTEELDAWNLDGIESDPEQVLAIHRLITALQEGGELLGVVLLLSALLEELAALGGRTCLVASRR